MCDFDVQSCGVCVHRGRDIDWVGLQCTCAAGDEGGAEDSFRSGEKPHPSSSDDDQKGFIRTW